MNSVYYNVIVSKRKFLIHITLCPSMIQCDMLGEKRLVGPWLIGKIGNYYQFRKAFNSYSLSSGLIGENGGDRGTIMELFILVRTRK